MNVFIQVRREDWLERTAMGASLLCLVHCLALPLILAALPTLGGIVHLPEEVHVWLLFLVLPATGAALLTGYRRHRDVRPLMVGGFGLALVTAAALLLLETRWEMPVTVAGSLFIAAAHVFNWTLRHRSAANCCG